MGFRCGIVGLPNVGKSTIFNAMTAAGAAAENYPFCTIEPNIGVVPLPDGRLDRLARIFLPEKVTPTTVEFAACMARNLPTVTWTSSGEPDWACGANLTFPFEPPTARTRPRA